MFKSVFSIIFTGILLIILTSCGKTPEEWNAEGVKLFKEVSTSSFNEADKGKFKEAAACFDKAVKGKPDYSKAWNNKGVALYNIAFFEEDPEGGKGKDKAIECYNKALELDPKLAVAWYNKGLVMDLMDKNDEALKCFDRALEANPEYANAWQGKSGVLYDLGRDEEGDECVFKSSEGGISVWTNRGEVIE